MPRDGQLKVEDGLTYEWQEPPGEWVVQPPYKPLEKPAFDILKRVERRDVGD